LRSQLKRRAQPAGSVHPANFRGIGIGRRNKVLFLGEFRGKSDRERIANRFGSS
jgi:hypothetical protein